MFERHLLNLIILVTKYQVINLSYLAPFFFSKSKYERNSVSEYISQYFSQMSAQNLKLLLFSFLKIVG